MKRHGLGQSPGAEVLAQGVRRIQVHLAAQGRDVGDLVLSIGMEYRLQ